MIEIDRSVFTDCSWTLFLVNESIFKNKWMATEAFWSPCSSPRALLHHLSEENEMAKLINATFVLVSVLLLLMDFCAFTHALTSTRLYVSCVVMPFYPSSTKLIESHAHVLHIHSPLVLHRFVISSFSCWENLVSLRKFDGLGNWGHLHWQECSNYLNLGSVLHEMAHAESFSCHKQHFSFAQLSFQAEV